MQASTKYIVITYILSVCFQQTGYAQPTPQDCEGSTYVCNNTSFSGNSSGHGAGELNSTNRGCLAGNENQSSWYYVTVQTGGTITMLIDPANHQDDYDFAIWGPFTPANVSGNCPPVGTPIRCSWASGIYGFFNDGGVYYGIENDDYLYWYGSGANYTQVHSTTGLASSYYHAGMQWYYGGSGIITVTGTSENDYGDGYVTPITASAGDIYILLVDNYSSSSSPFNLTWGGTAVLGCASPVVLSVELTSFTGEYEDRKNILNWETASETNNDYFEIERSIDGDSWSSVGTMIGNGTTNTPNNYQIEDYYFEHVLNYYRLNQIDFDGKKTTHKIITIDNSLKNKVLEKIVNTLGQEVDENYKGMVLYVYSDGTVVKTMQ